MFGALFDEDAATNGSSGGRKTSSVPEARGPTGFCGLDNLGTTCYLNSLLQTMFLTPGFRDALFRIPLEDLGYQTVDGEHAPNARTIPFELQSLFAAMARQDQSSVSTEDLTKSFGWSAGDAVVQHDVQELNRILFDAIEQSLVGTPYAGLIQHLYGGSLVNLIKCRNCNNVRRRDERFLDVTVPLQGLPDLPAGLASYTNMEVLDGANQYRCETCNSLQDAEKGIRLQHLPPILALSLNRFSYDWQRETRVKVTAPFPFPLRLNMAPYCENAPEHDEYELYSVVIHGGAAHGGHYHAYIRDIYSEGNWSKTGNDSAAGEVVLKKEPKETPTQRKGRGGRADSSKTMMKAPQDPLNLLVRIVLDLSQERPNPDISDVSQKLSEKIGHSWNIAYKHRLGPLSKYFMNFKGLFLVKDNRFVSLTEAAILQATSAIANEEMKSEMIDAFLDEQAELEAALALSMQTSSGGTPEAGQCWFDFNDSRVSCIPVTALEKQYGGKESAYMLFYANSAFMRAHQRPVLPSHWDARLNTCNMLLTEARRAADLASHSLDLHLHLAPRYRLGTVLHANHAEPEVPFTIDERTPTSALAALLRERFPELVSEDSLLMHVAVPLRDGQLVLQSVLKAESETSTLLADGFRPQMHVFLGTIVDSAGEAPQVGGEVLPVRVTDGRSDTAPEKTVFTYSDTSLAYLRNDIADAFECDVASFVLVRADRKQWTKAAALNAFAPDKDRMPVSTLGVVANMHLLLVPKATPDQPSDSSTPDPNAVANGDKKAAGPTEEVLRRLKDSVTVNLGYRDGKKLPTTIQLPLDTAKTIGECRLAVAAALGCDAQGTRLKVQRQGEWELLVPEDMTAKAAHIDGGTVLGLETGALPAQGELFLLIRVLAKKDTPLMEVILQQSITVAQAVATLVAAAGLDAGDYYLAKTNWSGDPDKSLADMDQTLGAVGITHNAVLALQAGRVVPKGSARVGLFLDVEGLTDTMRELVAPLLKLPDRRNPEDIVERLADLSLDSLVSLSEVLLPLTASIADIKDHVLALPAVAAVCSSTDAIRLRDMEGLRMTRMLSDSTRLLKQLKFPPTGKHLAVTILPEVDMVESTTLFLNVCRRYPSERKCSRTRPILFNGGNTPTFEHLTNILSVEFGAPPEELVLAKYDKSSREWKIFDSSPGAGKKGRRKPQKSDGNVREVPYLFKDGDLLALKLRSEDPKNADDFSIPKHRDASAAAAAPKRAPRPEPRLAIHVPSFQPE